MSGGSIFFGGATKKIRKISAEGGHKNICAAGAENGGGGITKMAKRGEGA